MSEAAVLGELGAGGEAAFWAKSGDTDGHRLILHMLDVAAVTEAILAGEPETTPTWAARCFGIARADVPRWLAAMAGLHDFGKATPGFQCKWPVGMEAVLASGLRFDTVACGMGRHDLSTAALLRRALDAQRVAERGWLRDAVQAVSAHHGYHFLSAEVREGAPRNEPAEWQAARAAMLSAYWNTLAPVGTPTFDELSLPAVNWLAGLTSVADWIASNTEWFAQGRRGFNALSDYYRDALRLARAALDKIGWPAYRPLLRESLGTDAALARILARPGQSARRLQEVGDQLLASVRGPALLIVEAPMGEGKTELAFLAHLRLQAANNHRGLYVALPTQATGNALFERALTFLRQFVDTALDVQLVHGGARTNETARALHEVRVSGIDENADASLSASAWFSQRKRPLLSPYGVGTVDQALFAVLNVKHHFVRLWGLANRVVVLDEVHAYDTYTSGLIAALLRWLKALGCSVVLMSATLPRNRRAELLSAWGVAGPTAPEPAYPRLLMVDDAGMRGEPFEARSLAPIDLVGLDEAVDTLAAKALALLDGGGCGALIVNTVARAQALYVRLREQLDEAVPLLLFHARFPADERAERERDVLTAFGAAGTRPARALLVATQVAEQSLDIDFDFMLSDLAPVDLLLQRAGRLHRHKRDRPPAHAQARLHIAGLRADVLPELKETAWEYVYEPYILLRTWAQLRGESTLTLPGDIDRLVQSVYDDSPLPIDLQDAVREQIEIESYGAYLARVQKERRESLNISIDPEQEPREAYDGKPRGSEAGEGLGLENKTRLGRESISVIPVHVGDDGWRVGLDDAAFSPDALPSDVLARQLYDRQLKVSRAAVVKRLKSLPSPGAFAHPLLRDCFPLPLTDSCYVDGALTLRLDRLLGLVFESSLDPKEGDA